MWIDCMKEIKKMSLESSRPFLRINTLLLMNGAFMKLHLLILYTVLIIKWLLTNK